MEYWWTKISERKVHLAIGCVFLVLSVIVTISNLGFERDYIGDDAGVRINYPDVLKKSVWSMWDEIMLPGRNNAAATFGFIYSYIILAVRSLDVSGAVTQRLLFFAFFFFSGTGSYLLFIHLARKEGEKGKSAFLVGGLAGLIYAFNYFTAIMVSFPLTNYHMTYLLLPWITLTTLKTLESRMKPHFVYVNVLLFLLLTTGNPSNTLSVGIVILIVAFFLTRDIKLLLKYCITVGFLLSLLTTFIYMPILHGGTNPYSNVSTDANYDSLRFNSNNTSFLNLLRFYGHHSAQVFAFNEVVSKNPVFIYASFLLPLLILAAVIMKKPNRTVILLLALSAVFLFLAKGVHPPFEAWFYFLFDKLFILQMYRATYYKFVFFITFSFSMLAGFAVLTFKKSLNPKLNALALCLLPVIVFANAWPLVSGKAARTIHQTNIPKEYDQAAELMRADSSDTKMLAVPQLPETLLDWRENGYFATSSYQDGIIFNRPTWGVPWFDGRLRKYVDGSTDFAKTANLLRFLNIKYILVHQDVFNAANDSAGFNEKISQLNATATEGTYATLKTRSRFFNIYEINSNYVLPHIYMPDTVYSADDLSIESLTDIPYTSTKKEVFSFPEGLLTKLDSSSKTRINYSKINPTKYVVELYDASGNVPVVLNEAYDSEWQVYKKMPGAEGNTFIDTWFAPTAPTTHFVANGYANGWIINVNQLCKVTTTCTKGDEDTYDLQLIISYTTQKYFQIGLLISGITLCVFSCVVLRSSLISYKKRVAHVKK